MRKYLIFTPFIFMPFGSAMAVTKAISVSGVLHNPIVCTITGTGTVAFGDILSSSINGSANAKPVDLGVTCTNMPNPMQSVNLKVTTSTAGSSSNKIPITGTAKGFDLALKRNDVALPLGTDVVLSGSGPLGLTLTPTIKAGVSFVPGNFGATATVEVNVV
jgi:hypothetical protein